MERNIVAFAIALNSVWLTLSAGIVQTARGLISVLFTAGTMKLSVVTAETVLLIGLVAAKWRGRRRSNHVQIVAHFAQINKFANDIVLLIDGDGRIIEANDRAVAAYGLPRERLVELAIRQLRRGPRDWREDWEQVLTSGDYRFEAIHCRADGSTFPVEVSSRSLVIGGRRYVQSIIRDISPWKAQERQITRLKDVYAALSQTNQCIVRVSEQDELFDTICRIAVRYGHFSLAWIGLVDEANRQVRPLAWAGESEGFLDGLIVAGDARSPFGQGPAGQAILTGQPQIAADYSVSAKTEPWHDRARQFGIRAAAAFPLRRRGAIVGTLNLYSTEVDFFSQDLVLLLEEMAMDISFALDRLDFEAEHRRTIEQLRRMSAVVEQSPMAVVITNTRGIIEFVNPAFCASSGYRSDELLGHTPRLLKSGETAETDYRALWRTITAGQPWTGVFLNRRKDGSSYREEAVIAPLFDGEGKITHFVGVKQDITTRFAAEARVAFLAHHDPLTGLPNRLLGREQMQWAMAQAGRNGCKAALMFLDLDHFKRINDSLGHSIGDALLRAVAERLRGCIRDSDIISRQGGDEFLIGLADIADAEDAARVAAKILEALAPAFAIDGLGLSVSASIGIALFPDDGQDFNLLLKHADTAMYSAKDAGRDAYRFFTAQMNVDADEYLSVRNDLQRALGQGQLLLHYQPQIDLASGRVVGTEALVRWNHPGRGLIPPGHFIPIAEDSGLIVPIGDWVIGEACRQAVRWRAMGLPKVVMAVNLSAIQFKRGDLHLSVARALAESGLDPACLELELTESILIKDTANVLQTVERLKDCGIKLSIDDFGTGYSSLAYLKQFAVDKLKIDQSFISHITTDPNDEAIVRAIIQMAHTLGLVTIAEGVEDAEMLAALRRHGCDEVQGYYFARPMAADQAAAFISARP